MASLVLPDFIQYLFSSKPKFDCYFEVWNQDKLERIGAVKLMLMAHSEVFRTQLEESELKEKDVPIKDIHPETFKGMLKYVYGQDTTPNMSFDEADDLLYVAEKYMMKPLKDKLATRLMELLNPDNICTLLNNPACYTHLQLDAAITDILRNETDRVLASPQFLWMNADSFLKILEQDGLAVGEIDLWRAAIKWAEHRAKSKDSKLVRQQISGFTRNLRLCSMAAKEAFEVITSGVLSADEVNTICLYNWKEETPVFEEFSNITEPRKRICFGIEDLDLAFHNYTSNYSSSYTYSFTILTKIFSIELLPMTCYSRSHDNMEPENWTSKADCTTTITKVANPYNTDSSSINDPLTTVSISTDVKFGEHFQIPLGIDGKGVILEPDTKYSVTVKLSGYHRQYYSKEMTQHDSNDHFTFSINTYRDCYYRFPFSRLCYRVVT